MDVSNREELGGQALVDALASLSGLPAATMETELSHILETTGSQSTHLTLEDLRSALLIYLEALAVEEENREAQLMSEN
jgi:hypothetical protein